MSGFNYLWHRSSENDILWILDFGEVAKIQSQKKCDKLSIRKKGYKKNCDFYEQRSNRVIVHADSLLQYAILGVCPSNSTDFTVVIA